jgi:hypothetical protein
MKGRNIISGLWHETNFFFGNVGVVLKLDFEKAYDKV